MFKSIYNKMAIILFALFCFIGIIFTLINLTSTQYYIQEIQQKLNKTLAEHITHEKILLSDGNVNKKDLKDIFHMLMVVNPSIELYLLNPQGAILDYSAPPEKIKRKAVSLSPINQFLNNANTLPILGDDPRDSKRTKVFSVAPILKNDVLEGYIYIVLGGEQYDSIAKLLGSSYILQSSLGVFLISLILALLIGLLLFKQLTKPLRNLITDMSNFKYKDILDPNATLKDRKKYKNEDEIAAIKKVFVQMTRRIDDQIKALKEADTYRREFISNISHDLRTPLTSLGGYIETLTLKKDEISAEEQNQYLSIAAKHCSQLDKLVSELFEQAKLDSPDMKLNLEFFSLVELTQDILQKFNISFKKSNLKVEMECDDTLPLVWADISLIERVFDNLIENAIRHTPKNGAISITLKKEIEKVAVSVKDTGCGISPEDQSHIFDRFYKSRNNKEDSNGIGLGLAITKKILNLHNSTIAVESNKNLGSSFHFNLYTKKESDILKLKHQ